MEWIRKNKKALIFSTIVSLILSLCALYSVKILSETSIQWWHLLLILAPWILTIASFFPLVYLGWFGSGRKGQYTLWFKIFFWFCIIASIVIWVMIYAVFILQITFMHTL